MRAAYAHAIAAGYRFYSYGDASLLLQGRLMAGFPFNIAATDGRRGTGVLHDAARRHPHAGLHAGGHGRHGQGADRRPGARRPAPTSSWATPIT